MDKVYICIESKLYELCRHVFGESDSNAYLIFPKVLNNNTVKLFFKKGTKNPNKVYHRLCITEHTHETGIVSYRENRSRGDGGSPINLEIFDDTFNHLDIFELLPDGYPDNYQTDQQLFCTTIKKGSVNVLNFVELDSTEYIFVFYAQKKNNAPTFANADRPNDYPHRNYISFIEKDSTLDKLRNICAELIKLANADRVKQNQKYHKYKCKYLSLKNNM